MCTDKGVGRVVPELPRGGVRPPGAIPSAAVDREDGKADAVPTSSIMREFDHHVNYGGSPDIDFVISAARVPMELFGAAAPSVFIEREEVAREGVRR